MAKKSKGVGQSWTRLPRPDLSTEDRARLVWIAGQLGCTPLDITSLGLTWLIRHLQGMVIQGVFTTSDLQKWRMDYPELAYRSLYDDRILNNDPNLSYRLGVKYQGRPDLYELAARELSALFHIPPEHLPRWVLRLAIWGGYPPGVTEGYP